MDNLQTSTEEYDNKFIMLLKFALKMPCVKIDRTDFLKKELSMRYPTNVVELAISKNPAQAGISASEIESIAFSCIEIETKRVSLISFATGVPGGLAMFGTVSGDLLQYYVHVIRVLQKLIYLYGWPAIYNFNEELDDGTMNQLILFIGIMHGVKDAELFILKIVQSVTFKVEKKLANKALTKNAIFLIVRKVAKILGYKMTKAIFAKNVSKIVPVLGGVVSGSVTYVIFKSVANKLKNYLKNLPIADIEFYKNNPDIIDIADFSNIMLKE